MTPRAAPDPPPADVLRWVEGVVGDGARVVRTRRLTGGVETSTHQLTLQRGTDGAPLQLVLRRPQPWAVESSPARTGRLAAVLQHVAAHAPAIPAPQVVAVEPWALLMRKLPGRIDLAPTDPTSWLHQLADTLRAIHDIPPTPGARRFPGPFELGERKPPPWSAHANLWERALEIVAAGPARNEVGFVHGDYQHFNLLWSRGRLSGIVDWSSHALRPQSSDVGHCRLNLAILYGADVADDFLRRYGRPVDPWWDLLETVIFLPSWGPTITRQVGNRLGAPVDVDAIHRRVDEHLRRVVQSTIAG